MPYSNLKTKLIIEDWPIGFKTCRAEFWIESNKRGKRACRRTENKTRTGWNKTKKGTYSPMVRIATDGNGKTFLISNDFGFFYVMQGDMKHSCDSVNNIGGATPEFDNLTELFSREEGLK